MKRAAQHPAVQPPQRTRRLTDVARLTDRSLRCPSQQKRPNQNSYSLANVIQEEDIERLKARKERLQAAEEQQEEADAEEQPQEPEVVNPPPHGPGRPKMDADKLTTRKSKSKRNKAVLSGSNEVFAEQKVTPIAGAEAIMKANHPSATQWRTISVFFIIILIIIYSSNQFSFAPRQGRGPFV